MALRVWPSLAALTQDSVAITKLQDTLQNVRDARFLRQAWYHLRYSKVIPIQKVDEAYERVQKSDVRYRFVIDMASLKDKR